MNLKELNLYDYSVVFSIMGLSFIGVTLHSKGNMMIGITLVLLAVISGLLARGTSNEKIKTEKPGEIDLDDGY